MTDKEIRLVLGSLLHDVGKVVYRQNAYEGGHGQSGYEFLKDEVHMKDQDVLDCVRYHHAETMHAAELSDESLAYIVAVADRIVSAAEKSGQSWKDVKFKKSRPLQSVFNRLNRNHGKKCYKPEVLDVSGDINYPVEESGELSQEFYNRVRREISENLSKLKMTSEGADSLLEVLETQLSYVPVSWEVETDISLYDHVKFTASVASCVLSYLEERGITDYKEVFRKEEEFRREDAFSLYYIDLSGIQSFIYTITSQNAFRTLRVRSFYLEIMMEHIIDSLLTKTGFSRANLLYSGGGRCYILMPSSSKVREIVEVYMDELNQWLIENFDMSLYAAWGCAACSADSLGNVPEGSYGRIFQRIIDEVEEKKSHKYTAAHIIKLNSAKHMDYTRECRVCKKTAKVDEEGVCALCRAFQNFSENILYDVFFAVTKENGENRLPLPGQHWLCAGTREGLEQRRERGEAIVHIYSKNRVAGYGCTKLWVGDYAAGRTFEEYAEAADGIARIGIIRADVDNLGQTFVAGFDNLENKNKYVTLTRTAVLSRQLSLFFKLYINRILSGGSFSIDEKAGHPRKAAICYSGGDDLFIVGAWNEVIELALDIRGAFEKYTQGTLTFSAGIGVYEHDYPISAIANEVAELEEASKSKPGKNSLTLFPDGKYHEEKDETGRTVMVGDGTYDWREFEQCVIGEKYRHIYSFFQVTKVRGMNFLYHLLELIRSREDKIYFARYVYLLSRMEPENDADVGQKEAYREFSYKMYQWIKNEKDCRQLKTAIQLYVYLQREKEEM